MAPAPTRKYFKTLKVVCVWYKAPHERASDDTCRRDTVGPTPSASDAAKPDLSGFQVGVPITNLLITITDAAASSTGPTDRAAITQAKEITQTL